MDFKWVIRHRGKLYNRSASRSILSQGSRFLKSVPPAVFSYQNNTKISGEYRLQFGRIIYRLQLGRFSWTESDMISFWQMLTLTQSESNQPQTAYSLDPWKLVQFTPATESLTAKKRILPLKTDSLAMDSYTNIKSIFILSR